MSERPTTKRCAVYTRKSVEDGLEQDYNSLDAQRDAAENYIASQRANGWICLPEHYDDGGFSGGNMERPALKKLLEDVDSGLIDIIIVYKIDRLSRSLADFADLSTHLDSAGVGKKRRHRITIDDAPNDDEIYEVMEHDLNRNHVPFNLVNVRFVRLILDIELDGVKRGLNRKAPTSNIDNALKSIANAISIFLIIFLIALESSSKSRHNIFEGAGALTQLHLERHHSGALAWIPRNRRIQLVPIDR